ncbi:AAA family ATPase [Synechococcus sp. CS-197]|uniref:AAA family ATPase n=1 Tax=Synechococcus sp. CS-197 TaxID=2847985 RepID=UPI0001525CDF|nr:AAA family ATPase [Synechococcus sp. CS-197]MCT0251470.1 AAA family ATPase [Synechococcus sp. CS-197]CAK24594.1 ATPase related to the helicase subunit of the Holliday junction resolvase [Synechococcus sp. WH 7803]
MSGTQDSDLFSFQRETLRRRQAPLADRLRPRNLDEFVGQGAILAEGRLLRRAIAADRVGNLILHGPPGVGKTTLARIIANHTRAHFSSLNAVLAGVKDLRAEVSEAGQRLERHGLRTILFIDEVHRFNSAQQDALLPWVENGTLTLIGATTENPYFEVNKALVSRSRLFRLQALTPGDLSKLLNSALKDPERGYGDRKIKIEPEAAAHLVDVASGDARSLLNALELAVDSTPADENGLVRIDLGIAEESIQQRAVLYDKQGDAHFDTISAFIKSIRGSDPDAALFWLARMVEAGENPRFIFRRMLISAGEDVGLADPQAVVVVEACAAAFERIGLPEGLYPLAQAALYLAGTDKSNSTGGFFEALRQVRSAQRQDVPTHLRDANRDGDAFGDGQGYRYPHAFREHWVAQQYLPDALQGEAFWAPSHQGWEGQRRERILERRAAQLAAAVEAEDAHPLLVSSGPDQPQLERWLQRQLAIDGERLQTLRQRLWADLNWSRTDRVLMLGGRSLLWSLDPLAAVAEGGVMILCGSETDEARLDAQLTLLDPLQRPALLGDPNDLKALSANLNFEVIGGRLNQDDLKSSSLMDLWPTITKRTGKGARLRLLLSESELGPASALLEHSQGAFAPETAQALHGLQQLEAQWLSQKSEREALMQQLEACGWSLESTNWKESSNLRLDQALMSRWLGAGRPYRLAVERQTCGTPTALASLTQELTHRLGQQLPMRLQHWRIDGRRG